MKKMSLLYGGLMLFLSTMYLYSCDKQTHIASFSDVSFLPYQIGQAEDEDTFLYEHLKFKMHISQMDLSTVYYNNIFINTSHALRYPLPKTTYIQSLKDIRIYSIYDYNDDISAGGECTDFFSFDGLDKMEFIENFNEDLNRFSKFEHNGLELSLLEHEDLRLSIAPHLEQYQQFYIEIETKENTIMRDSTKIIYLIP